MTAPGDARARIIAATLLLVGSDGIAAITNRRIASRAGVSLGSITYHFPSQTDLLRAALTSFVDDETTRLRDIADTYRSSTLSVGEAAHIADSVAAELAFTSERIAPFELYVRSGRDPALRSATKQCWDAYDDLACAVLTALGVPDAEAVSPMLVATITGLQLRRLSTGDDVDLTVAIVRLIQGVRP